MDTWQQLPTDAIIIALLVLGIWQFRVAVRARSGNLTAALALLCALGAVFSRYPVLEPAIVALALVLGGLLGWLVAVRVSMIQIPAMVAFQNGAGGIAACLVSFVELTRQTNGFPPVEQLSGFLGILVGAVTFSGSMVAGGRLAGILRQSPTALPKHPWIMGGILLVLVALVAASWGAPGSDLLHPSLGLVLLSMLLGVVFAIRVGGADMPVLISFLNATSGLAAALCGIVVQNRLLIACGATVAASGFILTHAMCRAMNRSLLEVFVPTTCIPDAGPPRGRGAETASAANDATPERRTRPEQAPLARAAEAARGADTVILIPGYGMALAQAQFETVKLAHRLKELGKSVKFAVHPIAGRMPGHMHVLLAEAEADPDTLFDLEDINPEFPTTDLAIIVGACDVVNPAAIQQEGTPISGMPILAAQEARQILVCNLDDRPGYSGVENLLYSNPKAILMFGDAKASLSALLGILA